MRLKGNISLYALKAICALFVVMLHTPSIFHEKVLLQPFVRIAVPCFLLVSGYYLNGESGLDKERINRQLKKILGIVLAANLIYLLFSVFLRALEGLPVLDEKWMTSEFWVRWLLTGDNICYPYWYLTAYFQALLLLRLSYKTKIIYWLAPILLIGCVLLNRYSFLIFTSSIDAAYSRGVLCAFPCIVIGSAIRRYENRILSLSINIKVLLSVVVLLSYIEYALILKYGLYGSGFDYSFLTFPLAVVMFISALKMEVCRVGSIHKRIDACIEKLAVFGKEHTTNIYLCHLGVFAILKYINGYIVDIHWVLNCESVFLLSWALSVLFNRIKRIRCRVSL